MQSREGQFDSSVSQP
nr:unnamed protein product [Callosobruchus chinensis]